MRGPPEVRRLLVLAAVFAASPVAAETWRPIFNGRNLDGWTPKISHRPLGENWRDTFQVKDGVLRVSYENYPAFKDEFAHLFYKTPFSSYRLRLEYRIIGPQTPGAPRWAVRNSGVMLHSQAPETMGLSQSFPVSVEAQFLAGVPGETRPTGNVCTPGVTVAIAGSRLQDHCRNASSATYPEGQWVRLEVEVRGSRLIRHVVDGKAVLEYGDVRLAPGEFAGFGIEAPELAARSEVPLDRGYIALQGEGHPIEFRRIEILPLKD